MRITAGRFRGRELVYPRAGLRPTKSITRQAIFNIIGSRVRGAQACDLYAGGGALGIEALSRGAKSVVFVEQHALVIRFLRQNTKDLAGTSVVRGDVRKVLKKLGGADFDLVLADPPYMNGLVQATVDGVAQFDVLRPGGSLAIEHHRNELPGVPDGWFVVKAGEYGESHVTVMRRQQ